MPFSSTLCSKTITNEMIFQCIFNCITCNIKISDGYGICSHCIDQCHQDHEIELVARGKLSCDCSEQFKDCCIYKANQTIPYLPINNSNDESIEIYNDLLDSKAISILQKQCKQVITHSKESFWLSNEDILSNDYSKLSYIEQIVCQIYKFYRNKEISKQGGAEWWIQYKDVKENTNIDNQIDMHYDTDYYINKTYSLGIFPNISTVTYLSQLDLALPTLICNHMYEHSIDKSIEKVILSYPKLGKHIKFNGKLLHGVPYHEKLLPNKQDLSPDQQTIKLHY